MGGGAWEVTRSQSVYFTSPETFLFPSWNKKEKKKRKKFPPSRFYTENSQASENWAGSVTFETLPSTPGNRRWVADKAIQEGLSVIRKAETPASPNSVRARLCQATGWTGAASNFSSSQGWIGKTQLGSDASEVTFIHFYPSCPKKNESFAKPTWETSCRALQSPQVFRHPSHGLSRNIIRLATEQRTNLSRGLDTAGLGARHMWL